VQVQNSLCQSQIAFEESARNCMAWYKNNRKLEIKFLTSYVSLQSIIAEKNKTKQYTVEDLTMHRLSHQSEIHNAEHNDIEKENKVLVS